MAKKVYQLRVGDGTKWDTIQISAEVEDNVNKALGYAQEVNDGIFNLITSTESPEIDFVEGQTYKNDSIIYDSIYSIIKGNDNIGGKPVATTVSVAFANGMHGNDALLLFLGGNTNTNKDTFYSKVQVIPLSNGEDAYCFAYVDFKIDSKELTLTNVNIRLAPLLDSHDIIPSRFLPSYVDDVQDLFTITDIADKSQWSQAKGSNALVAYPPTNSTRLYKYEGTDWVDIGAPQKDKIYVCLHKTLTPQDNEETTIYRGSGTALVQIIDLTSVVGDIAAIKEEYLKKSSAISAVYATNSSKAQTMVPYTSSAVQSTIVSRDNNGAAYVLTPQDVGPTAGTPEKTKDGTAIVNKNYLKNIIANISIDITSIQ